MKIGTDGVLLGAWTSLEHDPFSILDIGSGTGILALMMAQRSNAEVIEAIEIDAQAFEQCSENFEDSPWGNRLFCYHASLLEFTKEIDDKYDLIICNPPFYSDNYKTKDKARDLARFQDPMPFEHLLFSAKSLLSAAGILSVVIPFDQESTFIHLANTYDLFPKRICRVKGNTVSPIKRSLIELYFNKNIVVFEELTIELERHKYTEDYLNLTKPFYLKM
jgi:tRNA1Val (adenine37-N6)-methyltransferase